HAALWAGLEQPDYAPDVDLRGIVATAPPTNLVEMLESVDHAALTRLHAYLLDSWRKVYPDSGLWEEVSEANRAVIPEVGARCGNEDAPLGQLEKPVLPDHSEGTAFRKLIDANEPTGRIPVPVMLAQGSADAIVPAPAQREWVQQQCAAGTTIDYREYAGADHLSVIYPMLSDQL